MQSELKEKVLNLLELAKKYDELHAQGLLKTDEADKFEVELGAFLKKHIPTDTILFRKFELENSVTFWKDAYPKKFLKPNDQAYYVRWVKILHEFAQELNLNNRAQGETIVKQGSYYTAKKIVQSVFGKAEKSIEIFDMYLDETVLGYFEELLVDKPKLVVSLIGSNNDFGKKLVKSTNDFNKEFNTKIKTKLVEIANITAHYRIVILDSDEIYEFSHSIKDLGKKETIVKKIDGAENANNLKTTFSNIWNSLKSRET